MEATPTAIINYFSGFKQNVVPLFQRPYTWSEKQWRTLCDFLPFVRSTFAAKVKTRLYYENGVKNLLAFERLACERLVVVQTR